MTRLIMLVRNYLPHPPNSSVILMAFLPSLCYNRSDFTRLLFNYRTCEDIYCGQAVLTLSGHAIACLANHSLATRPVDTAVITSKYEYGDVICYAAAPPLLQTSNGA
jgi:hypothetical protein